MKIKDHRFLIKILPIIGIAGFIVFYLYASLLYPGGSIADRHSEGFSWFYNYWCDLLSKRARNGVPNTARPFAIGSAFSLCFGIGVFYYLFPSHFMMRMLWQNVIKFVGILSMVFAFFLFTAKHDLMLNIAGVLGIIALIGTLVALKRNNSFVFLWLGYLSAFLILLNNYLYFTDTAILYLPFIQKITMVFVLIWIVGLNLIFFRTKKIQ